ncbi:MAG TPA: DNA phosphorothioation-associated putative methyltransferase [Pyrinomonadaceae bacterium]
MATTREQFALEIERHRAAIVRKDLSRPVRLALAADLLKKGESFFDYGCGRGEDVRFLTAQEFNAAGFDPYYFPNHELKSADVVNLGYVLNVIENERERHEALLNAWRLARKLLIVAAQVWIGEPGKGHLAFNDGFITARNTFQKYYHQIELKQFIDEVLGVDAIPAGLGIYFVFRDETEAERFRASRFRSNRASLPSIRFQLKNFDDYLPILQPLIDFVSERGRLPVNGELKNETAITKEFRTLSRAFEIIKRSTNLEEWQRIIEKRGEDLLVYIALSRFERRPKFTALPPDLQQDVKAFFGNYKRACDEGDKLLFSLGQSGVIGESCRKSPIGKFVGNALYVHLSALNELNPVLRIYEGCASRTFGQLEQTTLIKFRADKPKVSYLHYPDFDTDPHPALHSSMGANLSSLWVDYRDYSTSENPPILHRKETFVASDYPLYEKFAKLTTQEEKYGLLENPVTIGTKNGWQERLDDKRLKLQGHRIVHQKL